MHPVARLDHRHVWHPFTQMQDWLKEEPCVLVAGRGAVLRDIHGREYLDANASIWTNLHGHGHPRINAAIRRQLAKVAHVSALGFANEPASHLAERLVRIANPRLVSGPRLGKVFFSDDGSTALEVALKQAYEVSRRSRGPKHRPRFLSLKGAYHGDTIGAVSLGHVDLFHRAYSGLLFRSDAVMAPYCYRCPHNRAAPERADARTTRRCQWECVDAVARRLESARKRGTSYSAFVVEPGMQGAAGMIPQPPGWLRRVAGLVREHGALLIADEVMTGLGRACEVPASPDSAKAPLFASHQEGVQPDFLCIAKGLTGGYLPMAATLTTREVFDAFLGEYPEFKTFFHGHTFTANPLGAAAALASLDLLESRPSLEARARLQSTLETELASLWSLPWVGDIRRNGSAVGVELVRDWTQRTPFDLREQAGIRVCRAMARRGVLTRPIGNVVVLMPPYCTTPRQVRVLVATLREAIAETFGPPSGRLLAAKRI
ncbi:MAG: adenosylmethionine--8-amino-7-oxononanoate transaminase [Verrucomicrobiae bacterium]|nr:adenosylmethionine--8-amino-7-oxononanoate transaminase [Verrucomicrobiae bacterium]